MASIPVFSGRHVREFAHEQVKRQREPVSTDSDLNLGKAGQKFVDPDSSPLPRRKETVIEPEQTFTSKLLQVFSPRLHRSFTAPQAPAGPTVEQKAYPEAHRSGGPPETHRSISVASGQQQQKALAAAAEAKGRCASDVYDFTELKRTYGGMGSHNPGQGSLDENKFSVYAGVDAAVGQRYY